MEAGGEPDTTVGDQEMTLLSGPPCELWQWWRQRWSTTSCSVTTMQPSLKYAKTSGIQTKQWGCKGAYNNAIIQLHLQIGFCEAHKLNKSPEPLIPNLSHCACNHIRSHPKRLTIDPLTGEKSKIQYLSYQRSCLKSEYDPPNNLITSPTIWRGLAWPFIFGPEARVKSIQVKEYWTKQNRLQFVVNCKGVDFKYPCDNYMEEKNEWNGSLWSRCQSLSLKALKKKRGIFNGQAQIRYFPIQGYFHVLFTKSESILTNSNAMWSTDEDKQLKPVFSAAFADLTGTELVDEQGASLRVFPAVEAVQLCGHLVQLLISVVELGQELSVRPLHKNTNRGTNISCF